MFGFPIVISVVQTILMLFVFNYDTPKMLKQKKHNAKLNELMGKIYEADRVQERINAIVVDEGTSSNFSAPSFKESLISPKYMYATIVGCLLSALQ